ncbi:hypothetical protein PVAP13_9NG742977 [Panicum virgatum]|uniref:Uncharacterized protein n=1 Tax=Panicum virgatum TaxID=38727 RepID=A0A8T0N8J8_PANVG|nr:hypothetical protein PVAP13_9NG742977 [Panicum virgatum]
MNRRIKEVANRVVTKASKASKSLFQGSSSSSTRREALMRCLHPELQDTPIEDEGGQEDEGGEEEESGQEEEDEGGEEEEEEDDEDSLGGDSARSSEFMRLRLRKSHVVCPPSIPTRPDDRVLIIPTGDDSWQDTGFDGRGHHRQVNAVLGNLCRLHNPGVVTNKHGEPIACTAWKDFALAPDARFGNAQGAVKDAFWKRYRVDPADKEHADRVLDVCAKKVCRDAFSNARLQVTNQFMKTVKGLPVFHFRQYSDIYLTAEEYQQVQLPWLEDRPDAYRALCVLWASEAFQEKSKKKRHCATKGVNHTFGGDGYIRTAKRMEVATGVEPSPIDVYLRGHRGPDPAHPEVLCSQQASDRLELYGQEMIRRHGENFDWRKGPIDPEALHASGGGKAHGRVVDSRDIQTRRGSSS